MKKPLLVLMMIVAVAFIGAVYADNRAETKSTCHFAPDPANDDNEVYASVCSNSIETYDAGDGQGQLAYSETWAYRDYAIGDQAFPKSVSSIDMARRGADTDADRYDTWHHEGAEIPYVETANTACNLVTHNYANGADNYTEYSTNDYNVEYWWTKVEDDNHPKYHAMVFRLNMHMVCRGAVAQ